MEHRRRAVFAAGLTALGLLATAGCRNHMPHAFTWANTGDVQFTHPKPPEGGYWTNWDPYAAEITLEPIEDVNPVRTQHVLVATVRDKDGKPLPNRRVEWIIGEGSVGDIVEVDESGWRASRGYKVDNHFAVSHTNNFKHVLDRGNSDPSDDVQLLEGQTFCVITSPIEGDTYITAYAPGIYDWAKHKVFAVKHWYDIKWECPPPATNPTGTTHELVTRVSKYSDNAPLSGYLVTYTLTGGPAGGFEPGGSSTVTVPTDADGNARVTLRQSTPAEGTNTIAISIVRPENIACCKPAVKIADCETTKTWIGPKIAIAKTCTPSALVGEQVSYSITVSNPSQVDATNVVVTDAIPSGIEFVSATPAPSGGNTWSLGTLPGGGSTTINITARAARTGTFENCAEVRADMNLADRACCTTVVTAPALAIEKRCTAEIVQCDPIEYVITVRNTGDGVARNVQVSDTLPEGITTDAGATSVNQNLGDLGPGQAKEIRFMARASRTGSFTNSVRATADGGLTAESSCTTVVSKPELALTKTGPSTPRYLGRNAEFTITVTNNGNTVARDTVLTDSVPPGLEFVSASDGGTFGGGNVTWRLGNMDPGATRTVTVTLKVNSAGTVENKATVAAFCADASGVASMTGKGIPAVLLEVIDLEDPDEIGTTETYVITVTNQGSADDTNIRIVAEVQPEAEFVSATGATPGQAAGRTVTFAPLPMLAPKAKAEWRVTVKGTQAGDTRFKVTMTTDNLEGKPVEETESTRFYE